MMRTHRAKRLDGFIRKKRAITLSLLMACALIAMTLYQGYSALQEIRADPVEESDYADVKPVDTPGGKWAQEFSRSLSSEVKNWKVSDNLRPHIPEGVLPCAVDSVGHALLATSTGEGDGKKSVAQVYGAGQGGVAYEKLIDAIQECGGSGKSRTTEKGTTVVSYDDSVTVLAAGDAIAIAKGIPEKSLVSVFEKTLEGSECVSFESKAQDASRSFYYAQEDYRGLDEKQTLEPEGNIDGMPSMLGIKRNVIDYPYAEKPEAPLPKSIPDLPSSMEKPDGVKSVKKQKKEDLSAVASYKIADIQGPGCGWKWSGQKSPVYDDTILSDGKKKSLTEAQDRADGNAEGYIDDHVFTAFDNADRAVSISNWNNYADKVNKIHSQWRKLRLARQQFYPQWSEYVSNYRSWESFDERKEDARKKYDDAVQRCDDADEDLRKWEEEYGERLRNPSPTPTPEPTPYDPFVTEEPEEVVTPTPEETLEPIPPKPAVCSQRPARPSILDQEKPAEPVAPKPPKDVTIPNSWENPAKED